MFSNAVMYTCSLLVTFLIFKVIAMFASVLSLSSLVLAYILGFFIIS